VIEIVWHRHRVQDEIELARLSIHLFWVSRNNNLLRAQFQGVLTFALGGCKRHYMSAKGSRELDPHMTQTTDADNTDFAPSANLPVAQWRPHRDSGTEERRYGSEALFREVEL
jgi:hypothetical protein